MSGMAPCKPRMSRTASCQRVPRWPPETGLEESPSVHVHQSAGQQSHCHFYTVSWSKDLQELEQVHSDICSQPLTSAAMNPTSSKKVLAKASIKAIDKAVLSDSLLYPHGHPNAEILYWALHHTPTDALKSTVISPSPCKKRQQTKFTGSQ